MAPERTVATDDYVCVCVATYRRPVGLARLLDSLDALDAEGLGRVEVIVADNDASESARPAVEAARGRGRFPTHYVCEPQRGIARVRNTLVREARERGARWIAFVDDDEAVEPHWLGELLRVMHAYDADVVTGPVLPVFEDEATVPRWMLEGGYFDLPRFATGTLRHSAFSNNTLVRATTLDRLTHLFDDDLKLSGGEDVELFTRVHHAGARIVWADDAVVREVVPPSRTRLRWLLRRSFQVGYGWGSFRHRLDSTFRQAMRGLAKGALQLPWAVTRGRVETVDALRLIMVGAGYIAAKGRVPFSAYGRTDGR